MRDNEGHTKVARRVLSRLSRRRWPAIATVLFVLVAMAYSLFWAPVVRHESFWLVPGDIWGSLRSAHYIGWGDFGGVYGAGTRLVTFPGILLVLTPVAMISNAFGLTEDLPYSLNHPSAWYVLGPVELLVSCTALFACDALAERLGIGQGRRALIAVAGAVALFNVAQWWGHPEDAVSVAFALYALVMALDDRWTASGWLFGVAVAFQPLVLLMFPVVFAMAGKRNALGLVVRSVTPAALLLITPLIAEFHVTFTALVDQPNFPTVNHITPWTSLAPILDHSVRDRTVAGGPGRVLALVLAVGLGWWARKWRHRPDLLVWAAGAALALRCVTESVMDPFYIWPPLVVALVVAGRAGWMRLVSVASLVGVMGIVATWRFGPWWAWWAVVVGAVVIVVGLCVPRNTPQVLTQLELKVDDECADESRKTLVGALQG